MNLENDFVTENFVTIKIEDREFTYKPTTAGDENNWLNECIEINQETKKPVTDWAKYNRCKLENIAGVPYGQETIKKIIEIDKPWSELTKDERWTLIGKMKPGLFDKLLTAMKQVDEPDESVKKN